MGGTIFILSRRPVGAPRLSREEMTRLPAMLEGTTQLMARLMYGTGLRLMECVRLRVKDVDFARGQIFVREGKGGKDRVVMLPKAGQCPYVRISNASAFCTRKIEWAGSPASICRMRCP
jgi:integrase